MIAKMSNEDLKKWHEDKKKCEEKLYHVTAIISDIFENGKKSGDYEAAIKDRLDIAKKQWSGNIEAVRLIEEEMGRREN